MIHIGNITISDDLVDQHFFCDLEKCKGACCIEGDAGAPLNADEVVLLPQIIDRIKPYLRKEGIEAIEQQGTFVIDFEQETVTPLIKGNECAYVIFENGIAKCGIEKAYFDGVITLRKPVSCHLYPLRIKRNGEYTFVNYDRWSICEPARQKGIRDHVHLREFVKDALMRRFGKEWYKELQIVIDQHLK